MRPPIIVALLLAMPFCGEQAMTSAADAAHSAALSSVPQRR